MRRSPTWSSTLSYRRSFSALARFSVSTPAPSCCWMRRRTSWSRRAAVGIEEEVERGVRIPVGRGFAGRVAADRQPVVLDDVDHADVLNPLLREKGIKSMLGVPLLVGGRVLGVLHVGTLVHRVFDEDDVELLQLAGDRAAIAIGHARAFEAERWARRQIEHVQTITDAALAHLELDDLFAVLLPRIRDILEADTCAVLLVDEEFQRAGSASRSRDRGRGRARCPHPDRRWFRRPRRGGQAAGDPRGRRSCRCAQPDLAREGDQVDARCTAACRRRTTGRDPRRHACSSPFHSRGCRPAEARRRPGRDCDRACPAPRAGGATR